MLEEVYSNILEKFKLDKIEKFEKLLKSCIREVWDQEKEPDPRFQSITFKISTFFEGFTAFQNFYGKDKKYVAGAEVLYLIFEELQVDIDESECFILYHIRDLGKFRKREAELLKELTNLWQQFPDYRLGDRDFSKALKNMMRNKLIQYRKGNLHLNPSVLLRYEA